MGNPGDKRARRARKRRQAEQRRQAAHGRPPQPSAKGEPNLDALRPRLDQAAQELVDESAAHQPNWPGCPAEEVPYCATRDVAGWRFLVSSHAHGDTVHWGISGSLRPMGRGSKPLDWHVLGYMVAAVQDRTGLERDPKAQEPPGLLTPMEITDPNRVHHWVWHADGSPLDPVFEKTIREFLNPSAGEA